jgi:ABC-type Fe3+-hydroxamate transport system substrate-binding protein
MQLIDALGTLHTPDPAARIVSLVPSITELLCDLGLAPQLVGRTGFCIHPADMVSTIPKIGGTKDVNVEKIRRLAPTHLVVNMDENEKPTVEALAEFVPHVVVTHPVAPRDNLDLARLMGGVFCAGERAAAWCRRCPSRPPAPSSIASGKTPG